MGRRRSTLTGSIVVVLCLLVLGCNEDPVVDPAVDPAVDAALADLTAKGSVKRLVAVKVLRDSGWSDADVMRLALRIVKWDEDTGLLADLLATYPDAMLPPLLHRIVYSASTHRAQICRALARERSGSAAAVAVLLVRALLEPDEHARIVARLALKVVSPPSTSILRAHDKLYGKLADGSPALVSPGLVLGGNLARSSRYGRYLRHAMRAEGERFGSDTEFRVLRFFAELGEETERVDEIAWALRVHEGADARELAPVLASLGRADPTHLRKLATRLLYVPAIGRAVGILGPEAQGVVEPLFQAYRQVLRRAKAPAGGADLRDAPPEGESWSRYSDYTPTADVLWGVLRSGSRSQKIQGGLVDLLDSDLVWIDRSMIEMGLRLIRPEGDARARLIDLAIASGESLTPAARSALRVVGWCQPPIGRLLVWLERAEGRRAPRPTRLRLRALRRHIEMSPEERREVARKTLADLERWSEPDEDG